MIPIIALIIAILLVGLFYFAMFKICFSKTENLENVYPKVLLSERQETQVEQPKKSKSTVVVQEMIKEGSAGKDIEKNEIQKQAQNSNSKNRKTKPARSEVVMDTLSPYRVYNNSKPQSSYSNKQNVKEIFVPEIPKKTKKEVVIIPKKLEGPPPNILNRPEQQVQASILQTKVLLLPETLTKEKPNFSKNDKNLNLNRRLVPLPSFGQDDFTVFENKNKQPIDTQNQNVKSPQARPISNTSKNLNLNLNSIKEEGKTTKYYSNHKHHSPTTKRVQFNEENIITSPVRNTALPNDFQIQVVKKRPANFTKKNQNKENSRPIPPKLRSPIQSDIGTEQFEDKDVYFASLENSNFKKPKVTLNTPKKELNFVPDLEISNRKTPVLKRNYRVIHDSQDERLDKNRHIDMYMEDLGRENENKIRMEKEFNIVEEKSVKAKIEDKDDKKRILRLD